MPLKTRFSMGWTHRCPTLHCGFVGLVDLMCDVQWAQSRPADRKITHLELNLEEHWVLRYLQLPPVCMPAYTGTDICFF